MGRVFPRFKWGKSHYLQVMLRFLLQSNYRLISNTHTYCILHYAKELGGDGSRKHRRVSALTVKQCLKDNICGRLWAVSQKQEM